MLELLKRLEDRLSRVFEIVTVGNNVCFRLDNGTIAHLIAFVDWKCIVVEYADNVKEAKKNMYEDGDQFYISEMSEEDLFNAIVEEMSENGA